MNNMGYKAVCVMNCKQHALREKFVHTVCTLVTMTHQKPQ